MESKIDILIIGGGLSGLIAALHLLKSGFPVTLIEKNTYPQHKVCGEYISNEVLPYLESLDIDISKLSPVRITNFHLSTVNGETTQSELPLGGFGISRYTFDHFLYEQAKSRGCQFIQETVTSISFQDDEFKIALGDKTVLYARIVIGAYGKRDLLDQKLSRNFIQKKSPWLAIKAHYIGEFPDNLIALHSFEGGYCGISKVENNRINICYLVNYDSFKKYKNIPAHRTQVLYKNIQLKKIFENFRMIFEQPITISQISFEKKTTVEHHILMIGDTAGLIHPLCGNGMAMAIHSAKIAATLVTKYLDGSITLRSELEKRYQKEWNINFQKRLNTGKIISGLLRKKQLSTFFLRIIVKLPKALPLLIRQTHGKPIKAQQW